MVIQEKTVFRVLTTVNLLLPTPVQYELSSY